MPWALDRVPTISKVSMLKPSRNCLTRVSSGLITLLPFCRTVRSIFTGGWNGLRSDAAL
ncbi:Uncharacterised protein [Acinetobacter baumannii]|nr:Uncharacterised protein [Acinetobacter baumannii]